MPTQLGQAAESATRFGAVAALMSDGNWRTLAEIALATGQPESGISARLRDLRKPPLRRIVQRRRRAVGSGTFEYRLVPAIEGAAR